MKIAVIGVGGVGGYFGGRLAQAGEAVTFIARGATLQALRTHGLKVESIKGDFHLHPIDATDAPAAVGVVDVVLVCVKAWQVPEVAEQIRPLVGPQTFIVPLQNGVDAAPQLVNVFGEAHVLGGLCRIISFIAAPGHIKHTGSEPYIGFSELDNHPSERCELLRLAFARAIGITVEIPADIHVALWEKFLMIATFSGVGALTRLPIGAMRAVPETCTLMDDVMAEIFAVGRAHGIALTEPALKRIQKFRDNLQPDATASMQRDIIEGRPSELEWQNGAVVRLGRAVGVPTPLNAAIYASLLPQELKARRQLT